MKRKTWPSSHASIRRHIFAGVVIVAFLAIGVGGWASTAEISGALIAQGSIVVDFERQEGAAPDRRRGRRAAGARRRPGKGRRHSHSPRRDRDPRQSRHRHQGSYRALRAQGAPRRRARRRGDPRDAEGARRIGQRSRGQGSAGQRAQAVRIAAQDPARPEGSAAAARRSNCRSRSPDSPPSRRRSPRRSRSSSRNWAAYATCGPRTWCRSTGSPRSSARRRGWTASAASSSPAPPQAKGKITETELQIIQVDQELSSDVAKELREIDSKIGEYVERKVTAEDQLKRTDIRAPQDGIVFQSTANTVGGVITAGDPIMLIVPETDTLLVEVKVDPKDIDQVKLGQRVVLRFSAFNQRTTPEINGTVARIAADTTNDQRTGQSYYIVRISMTAEEIERLGDGQAGAGHAGRSLHPDRRAHDGVLPYQAVARSAYAFVPREVNSDPPCFAAPVRTETNHETHHPLGALVRLGASGVHRAPVRAGAAARHRPAAARGSAAACVRSVSGAAAARADRAAGRHRRHRRGEPQGDRAMAMAAHRGGRSRQPPQRARRRRHRLRRRFPRAGPHVAAPLPPKASAGSTRRRAKSSPACRATMRSWRKRSRMPASSSARPARRYRRRARRPRWRCRPASPSRGPIRRRSW